MRLYDLVLILRPNLADAKRKQVIDSIKALLKDAKITKETELGQKVLAYPIKKEEAGFYVQLSVESENGLSKDLEAKLFQNDAVIRHLLVRSK